MAETHPHRIIERLEHEIDGRAKPNPPRPNARPEPPETIHEAIVEEQRNRGADSYAGFGPMSRSQARGAVVGALLGGFIGGLVMWPFGFIGWGAGVALGWRILACALIGVVAGATAGAVLVAGWSPMLSGEVTNSDEEGPAYRSSSQTGARSRR
jgi:hypothetical protein